MVPKWNRQENTITVTIKNIPEQIYERIKAQAKANHRSLNGEILTILEQAVSLPPIDVQATKRGWHKKFLPKTRSGLSFRSGKMNFAMYLLPRFVVE